MAMFTNKFVMRADPPSPSSFLLLQLHPSPSSSPPPPALELEILCWKLSRRWRTACFAQPSAVFIIYQKALREAAGQAVSEFVETIPDVIVGSEEELTSPVLIAKAVEIGLRCVMLDHKWTCVGDNTFIYSALSNEDERNPLCALNVMQILVLSSWFHLMFLDSAAYVLQGSGFTPAPQSIRLKKALQALESFTKMVGDWDFFSQGMLKIKEILPFGTPLKVDGWEKAANVIFLKNHFAPNAQASSTETNFTCKDLQMSLDFRTPKPVSHSDQIVKDFHNQQKPASLSKICAAKPLDCVSEGSHRRSTINFAPSFRKFSFVTSRMQTDHGFTGGIVKRISMEVAPKQKTENMAVCTRGNIDINLISRPLPAIKNSAPQTIPDLKLDAAYLPSFTRRKPRDVHKDTVSPKLGNDGDHANEKNVIIETSETKRSKYPKKEKDKMLPSNKVSENSENVPHGRKMSLMKERKRREDVAEGATKVKAAKPCPERSDITSKVMNFHKRGQLQSLTMADLKCFLSSKKAKVGGKKDELVQRVIALLP